MALSVSVGDSALSVEPGGFVRTEVRVRNDSAEPHKVRLRVTGPAGKWSWVVPPEGDVDAGAEVVMSLGFRIPKGTEPAAGDLAWELVAGPASGHDSESGAADRVASLAEAKVAGLLTVQAFHDVTVEFDPPDARSSSPNEHIVVVENRGNVPVTTTLLASSEDDIDLSLDTEAVHTEPGQRIRVPVTLHPGKPLLLQPQTFEYTVSAAPIGGAPVVFEGSIDQPARMAARTAAFSILAVVLLVFGLRFTVLAPDDGTTEVSAGGSTATTDGRSDTTLALSGGTHDDVHSDCLAEEHRDTRVTGLTPEDIPTLPADFSFFQVASDRCSPVRWNPCESIHFVINPKNAPPTGVADVREAFKRLAAATGITYVDDGLTDEAGTGNRAYQPERYGERWAPILVHWITGTSRSQGGDVQIVGGGFPTRVGDVYVTGNLFLNVNAIVNPDTRAPVPGGFEDQNTIGAIGPEGVTWGRVILHELAHITGLGHVREPSELMYPETADHTGPTAFGKGDLAGIKYLGKEAGCLETPKATAQANPQVVGGSRASGASGSGTATTTAGHP